MYVTDLPAAKASLVRDLLHDKKARDAEQAFVMEGTKPVRDLILRGMAAISGIVVTQRWLDQQEADMHQWVGRSAITVYRCRESIFDRISDVRTAQGVLAVVQKPQWDAERIFARPTLFGMFGEGLQDPANVGAILRTAAAFGLDGLWLSEDSADVYGPKVVRATAGTVLTLPVFAVQAASTIFSTHHCAMIASETPGRGSIPLRRLTALPARAILALGNESRGLSPALLAQAAIRFHIPVSPLVDSLNVAASAAIAAYYLSELRTQAAG